MYQRKVVTLCGSVRFWDKIQELYEKLELENKYAVIGITPHVMNRNFTEDEEDLLDELHRIKIDLADAIYVVNVNGYIGKSTREEIEYAKQKKAKTDEDLEIKNSRMEIHIDDIENGAIKDRKERKASDGDERLKNEINMEINDIRNKAKDELKLSNKKKI